MTTVHVFVSIRVAHYDTSEVRGKKHGSLNEFISSQLDRSLNWKDLAWLKSITKLPVIVKGIMTGNENTWIPR